MHSTGSYGQTADCVRLRLVGYQRAHVRHDTNCEIQIKTVNLVEGGSCVVALPLDGGGLLIFCVKS